jgi:formylglycine-generating enzyme required for sulfatase activity
MIRIPAGTFWMGSDSSENASPAHEVEITYSYYMDLFEVTNGDYLNCLSAEECAAPNRVPFETWTAPENAFKPITYVDWNMAKTYCEWRGARLPTEAEWEYAARSSDLRTYVTGGDVPDCQLANIQGCWQGTTDVGTFFTDLSPFGIYDMLGNVAEWVNDFYDPRYYAIAPRQNPTGPERGSEGHVIRGSAWSLKDTQTFTTYYRAAAPEKYFAPDLGFRCVVENPQ